MNSEYLAVSRNAEDESAGCRTFIVKWLKCFSTNNLNVVYSFT